MSTVFTVTYTTPFGPKVTVQHLTKGQSIPCVESTKRLLHGPGCVMTVEHADGGRDQHVVWGCSLREGER